MSEFVNYNKRDVSLPPGCKDLMDVLRRREIPGLAEMTAYVERAVKRGGMEVGNIERTPKHIAKFFATHAFLVTLRIALLGEQLSVEFVRVKGEPSGSVVFPVESGYDDSVRRFFANNHLNVTTPSGVSKFFYPELPVLSNYDISPFPKEPSQAAELTIGLFRDVCGVKDDDRVDYRWGEIV